MKFKRSSRIGALIVVAAAAGLVASAASDADYKLKPGARGTVCLDCHDGFREVLDRKHVHSPVKAGTCSGCHDPHASDHGSLLSSDPSAVCQTCHQDVVPSRFASAHADVLDGNCVACHDPHASDHPSSLRKAGTDLCQSCHAGVVDTARQATFGHAPARSDCLSCHAPHASETAASLLVGEEPGICVDCHDVTGAAFSERHRGYPVERGRCTTCHAPHGSDSAALLWDNVHAPVANRQCNQCHVAADAADPLVTKRAGMDLCAGCHSSDVNDALTAARPHWPVVSGDACGTCHDPHASPRPALLSAEMGALCSDCHQDVARRLETSHSKHQPVADGDCATCHEPHGSDRELLLVADTQTELCGSCHDWTAHSMHPIGSETTDLRNPNLSLDCESCHRTHGTEHDHLTPFESGSGLCVECHESFRR
jgi:predicted CXXCH cytochrome family protein